MKSFLQLIAFTIVIGAFHYAVFLKLEYDFNIDTMLLYGYMFALSLFFSSVLTKVEDPKRFVNYYMGFSGGKLMLSLFILMIYGVLWSESLRPFAISFLIVYFTFTAFEIGRLLRHLKN